MSALASERGEHIAEAVEQLPERERVILALRYQQELTFPEIGEILGVSESRICQLHTKAVIRMRALLPAESHAASDRSARGACQRRGTER